MSKKIIIKRYGNRRLYNSETRSYVKLLDIAQFIRDGAEIQVLDSRTGEDITKLVLTQIILEEEKSKKDLLPINFLYNDLIRHQQGWVQEFFQRHVIKTLEGVLPMRSELLSNLRQSLDFRTASGSLWERFRSRSEAGQVTGTTGAETVPSSVGTASYLEGTTEVHLESEETHAEDDFTVEERAELLGAVAFEEVLQRLEAMENRISKLEGREAKADAAILPEKGSAS